MASIARVLNKLSGGIISPDMVTWTGLIAHFPIAWLIYRDNLPVAAVLLVVFGLFDTLDGELARVQKRASAAGMILDASTDRIKEVILYIGISAYLLTTGHYWSMVAAVGALGASIVVSYVKAKGEMALTDSKLSANEKNKVFADGVFRFEIRMFVLIVAMLVDQLAAFTFFMLIVASYTAFARLFRITKAIRKHA